MTDRLGGGGGGGGETERQRDTDTDTDTDRHRGTERDPRSVIIDLILVNRVVAILLTAFGNLPL